jgi:fatty acid desaturase
MRDTAFHLQETFVNLGEYRRELDPIVRPETFATNWSVLGHVVGHVAVVTGLSLLVARHVPDWPLWAVLAAALVSGHSIVCLGFAGHELDHDVPVKHPLWSYVWENVAWIYSLFISTTIHRKAHILHHAFLNGAGDPNGRPTFEEFAADEGAAASEWLFPNRKHPLFSAFAGLWLVNLVYQMKLLFATLAQNGGRFDMRISRGKAWLAVVETFGLNFGVYAALWAAAGFHWRMGLYLLVMNVVGVTIGLAYICTNHLLNPYNDGELDPMRLTLTVKVPRWADFCHLRFSYHVEHHLYPNAGPANYPRIREALLARFPERYNAMGFLAAYKAILTTPIAHRDAYTLVDRDGQHEMAVPLPGVDRINAPSPVTSGA